MSEGPFIWNEKALRTTGDLMDEMSRIYRVEDSLRSERAAKFMRAYRAYTEHADKNIGYLTGYFDPDTATAMRELFDVSHPIFGRESPSMEKAFEAGKRMMLGEFDE